MSYPPPSPGYGYGGGYPQGGYQQEHPQGTTILVLGILSLVVCGLMGPFAWSMGTKALREIDANPGRYSNRSSVNAGRICGMIASILIIVAIVFYAFIIVIAFAGSSSS